MGEGCGSGFPLLQFDRQPPNLNSLPTPPLFGLQTSNPPFMNVGTNMMSTAQTSLVHVNPESLCLGVSQGNEPRGWFYCLPRFRQAFAPASNSFLKGQPSANPYENCKGSGIPKTGNAVAEKRFIVFDQSGDQTTLIFGTPTNGLNRKSPVAGNFNWEDPIPKLNENIYSGSISNEIFDENGTDVQSEMHEDTEELNALLYSGDDGECTEDEEVMSTGHSPSTITAQDEQFEGSCEEVISSKRLTKKRKLLDGSNDYSLLPMDNAHPGNPDGYADDEGSSCASGQNFGSSNMGSSSGNKRSGKDKIHETVNVLRSLIPGGGGKDAVVVLDEAIDLLKCLKYKAKTLGLGTL